MKKQPVHDRNNCAPTMQWNQKTLIKVMNTIFPHVRVWDSPYGVGRSLGWKKE
jgi:hypothetical protein